MLWIKTHFLKMSESYLFVENTKFEFSRVLAHAMVAGDFLICFISCPRTSISYPRNNICAHELVSPRNSISYS